MSISAFTKRVVRDEPAARRSRRSLRVHALPRRLRPYLLGTQKGPDLPGASPLAKRECNLAAAKALAGRWKHKRVPFFIDNTAFQLPFKKGRSKAPESNTILRQLFLISSTYDCLFVPQWISTTDNICADALSRGQLQRFYAAANEFSSTCQRVHRCSE